MKILWAPLGQPSEFVHEDVEELKKKKILFVAGGVGTAPVYPQVKWLHERGIQADAIIGAKTKDLVILEDEFNAVCNLYVTTDDGSYQRKGYGDPRPFRIWWQRGKEIRSVRGHRSHDYDENLCVSLPRNWGFPPLSA